MQTFTLNDVYEPQSVRVGECAACNSRVYTNENGLRDAMDNVFCDETCAIEHLLRTNELEQI